MSHERTNEGSSWCGREVTALTFDAIRDLLEGCTACLLIRGYLGSDRCERLVQRFFESDPQVGNYGVVPTLQIGKPLMPIDRQEYFDRAREMNAAVDAVYGDSPNQAARVRRDLERATGWTSVELLEEGRPYCTSLFVSFPPGAHIPLHVDRSSDIAGLGIGRFPRQLSWNIYLQPAEEGGDLHIYERAFSSSDCRWTTEKQGGMQLEPGVSLAAVTVIHFRPGDFILFDANRYHTVTEISGARNRVYVHGFVSVDPDRGEMSFWT